MKSKEILLFASSSGRSLLLQVHRSPLPPEAEVTQLLICKDTKKKKAQSSKDIHVIEKQPQDPISHFNSDATHSPLLAPQKNPPTASDK